VEEANVKRKITIQLAMIVTGACLLIAAGLAAPASSGTPQTAAVKQGGVLHFSKSIGITYVDPALAYFGDEWQFEYATCAKLMNYPDKPAPAGSRLYPEVAQGLPKISNIGKTYTFTVRKGFRYSTGKTITAADFKTAFIRGASGKMNSPAFGYEHEIIGADDFNAGKISTLPGVIARGNKLIVRLTRIAPDLLSRMTMPFFCPLPPSTPLDANGINDPPGSGPYYVAKYVPDRLIDIKRNKYYRGNRPHRPDEITYTLNGASLEACRLQTVQGSIDFCVDGIPPNTYAQVARQYGINRKNGQYFEKPQVGFSYLAMRTDKGLFANNVALRKAVNFALNRPLLVAQGGFHSGKPTDQILPPAMPGYRDVKAYPLKLNQAGLNKAKALARGHTRDGKAILFQGNRGARPLRAQVIKANLAAIGINVDVQLMSRATQKEREGRRSENFDMTDEGWIADYLDPFSFIGALLQGNTIQETENVNVSYFNVPKYNRAIEQAGRLSGKARFNAFGKLDVQLTTSNDAVPWASYQNFINRDFVSKHVGCYTYQPVFLMDLALICRK
jgi:peptide/nickel transport system substrate-binding protein